MSKDIKPGNILLYSNNQAKIGDFGLVTDDIKYGYAYINDYGYVDHFAKEIFDYGLTSIKTDIWALGMTVYRFLHGHNFYADNIVRPLDLVRAGGFAKKLPWLPHIPPKWRRFVRSLMNDDSARRPQDASEVMREIEKLPVTPDWTCIYTPSETKWIYTHNNRNIEVTWQALSSRRHIWEARSKPLIPDQGRERRLGGSTGIISKSAARQELEDFFESYAEKHQGS